MSDSTVMVRLGGIGVARATGAVRTVGVGSCVVLALYDPTTHVGALGHPVLPEPGRTAEDPRPGRYISTAVGPMLERMLAAGADRSAIHARIAGGASMFGHLFTDDSIAIGRRNIAAARETLAAAGIRIRAEDVGGEHGRSVELRVSDGRVRVTSAMHADVHL